jgi:hypothetical protein
MNLALTRRKVNFSSHKIENCKGLGFVKGWKAVGYAPGTVWTSHL